MSSTQAHADEKPTLFDTITKLPRGERWEYYEGKFLVPLDHATIPGPGPDFARVVHDLNKARPMQGMPRDHPATAGLEHLYRNALYKRKWKLQVAFKGSDVTTEFLPGGLWDLPPAFDVRNSSVDMHGTEWDDYGMVEGPRERADVMIVGKHPGVEEFRYGQNFIGPSSSDLHRALREIKVTRAQRRAWYVTNAVKHNRIDPTSGTMQKAWLKNCAPLLWEEILLVRPRFIACLGTEAITAVLGKGYTVTNMTGRVIKLPLRVPPASAATHADYDDLAAYVDHEVLVLGIPHPSYISHVPDAYPDLLGGLAQLVGLVGGDKPPDTEKDIRHSAFYVERPLAEVIDVILERAHHEWDFEADGSLPIAWDAEWHGRQPGDAGSYLRTVQFAAGRDPENAPKKATCIVLAEKGGGGGWFNSREEVAGEIGRLISGRHRDEKMPRVPTRHGGHFFKADIPWIHAFLGINFRSCWTVPGPGPKVRRFDGHWYRKDLAVYRAALKKAAGQPHRLTAPDRTDGKYMREHDPWELTRYVGGWDTGYMAHAVFEAMESYGLEHMAMRWTTCPRWDVPLERAKQKLAKEMGIKVGDLSGYGDIPDDEILPYSCYDADATLRLFWRLNFARSRDGDGFVDRDVNQKSSREPFWRTMLAALTFLEMEETGVTVDVGRGKDLIKVFELVRDRLTASLRAQLEWPAFNPNSPQQVREWIFGQEYNGAIDKKTGKNRMLMPGEGMSLRKPPIKTTGKPSKAWEQVFDRGDAKIYTPSVDKEVLGIYAHEDDRIKKLRDIRYVRQVLQSVLRPPKIGDVIASDDAGNPVYDESDEFDGGFLSYVSPHDGRVRSRFFPVETGRCSSAGPNLQNLAKRREDDYRRILGHVDDEGKAKGDYLDILPSTLYHDPIRSIVTAGTWDDVQTVLLEFDIISAEIAALAWESADVQMIEDVRRAMLKEDDPEFLDLHSATAVEAFKLTCAPTKKALKALGKPGLRVAAKNVRFGVPYGRSAEALSRQCREEGADVSVKDCQRLIDDYHARYPRASVFLGNCEMRPYDKGFMVGAFGRIRRFQKVDDKSVMAEQGRSAKNYPIQNLVADAIMLCMFNLRDIRDDLGLQDAFRVVLQIHDAVVLEVKVPYIEDVWHKVIPAAMTDGVPIMPRTLDGKRFCDIDPKDEDGDYRLLEKDSYRFLVDREIYLNWGQPIDPERARALGIPGEFLHA